MATTPKKSATVKPLKLNAVNLKNSLWEVLNNVKDGTIEPGHADAIASQAREIVRTVKVQLQISSMTKRPVPTELITFNEET